MKQFIFKKMTFESALIIKQWEYSGFVKKIEMKFYFDNYEKTGELRGPGGCYGYAVYDQDELIGLFEYYNVDDIMELGLALSPKKAGKGLSKDFILSGIKFGIKEFNYKRDYLMLNVNVLNKPAVNAYLKAGFIKHHEIEGNIEMRFKIPKLLCKL